MGLFFSFPSFLIPYFISRSFIGDVVNLLDLRIEDVVRGGGWAEEREEVVVEIRLMM